ncbi:hypothetical protein MF271_06340 [Deinococcus sp. KNUC1210]|uniref:hypothetical protein n=1 Tax=Deinococcus sp. KNUC1210 TaxID=2917691 RepID=UPI001EF0BC8B|nr:hypothetical protein [Deinococcus sp. KNUC1210]ULH16225.1 hypothetical protein MF271_06340 [Deinococcus sp. KNUC1210]
MNLKHLTALTLPLFGTLALAAGPAVSVNGKPQAQSAQVVGGQTYISLDVLRALGIPYVMQGGRLMIGAATPTATGGANERPSLSGCRNEWLFNGVWRVKVDSVTRITKDGSTPGWGVNVEIRNGTKATIMPTDAGWDGNGQGVQLAFADASTVSVDPYDVQKLTFNSFPQGGVFPYQLKFYATDAASGQRQPTKLLIELARGGIGDTTRSKGVAFTVPNPSLRVDLTCSR